MVILLTIIIIKDQIKLIKIKKMSAIAFTLDKTSKNQSV